MHSSFKEVSTYTQNFLMKFFKKFTIICLFSFQTIVANIENERKLMMAIYNKDHEKVTTLLNEYPHIVNFKESDRGWTLLMMASSIGDRDAVHILLNAGAEVNERSHTGLTAFWIAFERGHHRVTLDLVNARADPNLDFSITRMCMSSLKKFFR